MEIQQRNSHCVLFLITAVLFSLFGCTDDIEDYVTTEEESQLSDAITIDGEENYIVLPATFDVKTADLRDADFMTLTGDGRIYCERNDNGASRTAKIYVRDINGTPETLLYRQTPAPVGGSPLRQFYRHHGIGYSYNAVNGSYCNLRDFRCQLINRAVLDYVDENDPDASILNVNIIDTGFKHKHDVYTSLVDYVAEANFFAQAEGDILIFKGAVSASCAIFEEGTIEKYIVRDKTEMINAEYSLNYFDLADYAKKYPKLLTSSFRNALKKVKDSDDKFVLDDFINTYGTHVVVFSRLGARMTLDVQIDKHKFKDREYEKALAEAAISTLFKTAGSSTSETEEYKILRNSRCSFDVLGGKVSLFDKLIGLDKFDNTDITEGLNTEWINSVYFDDEHLEKSNVELIDMDVVPIWFLVPDEKTANKIEARITGNMRLSMDKFSNRNFINTSFEANPSSVTCRIGKEKNMYFDNPDVVDIIAANRHVATICREYVPEISADEKVQVAYPIYEGKVKLSEGLCIHGGKAYKVDWRYDNYLVKEIDNDNYDGKIYMTCGVLMPGKSTNVDYLESHAILGCERPGGININGELSGEVRKVFKHFGHFYLDTTNSYDNLPGWEYTTQQPSEAVRYPEYFKDDYNNRMVRSEDYVYILNNIEIGY